MAAFNACRYNPAIKAFAERLTKAGKPFKVVVTAAMRKLLTMLNALVKTNIRGENSHAPQKNKKLAKAHSRFSSPKQINRTLRLRH